MKLGLRGRIIAIASAVVAFAVVAVTTAAGLDLADDYKRALDDRSFAIGTSLRLQLERLLQYGIAVEDLTGFEEQCEEAVKTYRGIGNAFVALPDGRIVFHSNPKRIGERIEHAGLARVVREGASGVVTTSFRDTRNSVAVVPVLARSGAHVGSVMVTVPYAHVQEEIVEVVVQGALFGFAVLVMGVALMLVTLSRFVTRPVGQLIEAVEQMERRPLAEARPARVESKDELGRLAESFNRMLGGLQQTTVSKAELERRNAEISTLSEMSHVLLSAQSLDEAHALVPRFGRRLFPYAAGGALSLFNSSRTALERAATWGEMPGAGRMLPDECWALRRSLTHVARDASRDPACPHLGSTEPHLCVALTGDGRVIGALHLVFGAAGAPITADDERRAAMLAEQLSFILGNLRLREALRDHSVRDALTGLHNRRYLEETLERELARARRKSLPLAAIVVDIDHFKRFNDNFGHDGGDAVLREVAQALRAGLRGSDIVCRYGGEEFVIVLPEASLEGARQRAEELRHAVARLALTHAGKTVGRVTSSAGVAVYPQHAENAAALIARADEALYQAKHNGRNQVVVAARPADARPASSTPLAA